jgi:solute carrier family 13 (sodium-dependent dicarboxylate transporter), member 2/3/5
VGGETLPLAVTSLLPIVLLPLTGALGLSATTTAYGNPLVFLFLGGFVLALAMQRWGLHRRIALLTIRAVGTEPRMMVGGFMLATAGLSMWVSNTATTVMMLPIGVSVLALVATRLGAARPGETGPDVRPGAPLSEVSPTPNLAVGLMLGIAYAASIGSLATLIGTPPNTFLAGFLAQTYDIDLGFARWMMMALPLSWSSCSSPGSSSPGGSTPPRSTTYPAAPSSSGTSWPSSGPSAGASETSSSCSCSWPGSGSCAPPPGPAGRNAPGRHRRRHHRHRRRHRPLRPARGRDRAGVFTMDWETARQLPWGVLLLFGGGLALAAAVSGNGVDIYVGTVLAGLTDVPLLLITAIVAVTVLVLTELTSNTATTAALVPWWPAPPWSWA